MHRVSTGFATFQGPEQRQLEIERRRRLASILCVERAQISQLQTGPDGRRGVRGPGGALSVRLLELARAADGGRGEEDVRGATTLQDRGGEQVSPAEKKVNC